jgi:hypothetical protein
MSWCCHSAKSAQGDARNEIVFDVKIRGTENENDFIQIAAGIFVLRSPSANATKRGEQDALRAL